MNNETEPRWQWNAATSRTGMMLNADLCLLKVIFSFKNVKNQHVLNERTDFYRVDMLSK